MGTWTNAICGSRRGPQLAFGRQRTDSRSRWVGPAASIQALWQRCYLKGRVIEQRAPDFFLGYHRASVQYPTCDVELAELTTASSNGIGGVSEGVGDPGRLKVVRDTNLLDTSSEETFDSLSRLAVALIGVPASFLSLVDERRDFYKSQCGFPEPLASKRELTGRTFCHYALTSREPLVIEDTHANPIWRAVPTVDRLGVRASLGVPVVVAGQAIGIFCVIDNRPHAWTPLEIETLVQIARATARKILCACCSKWRERKQIAPTHSQRPIRNWSRLSVTICDHRSRSYD